MFGLLGPRFSLLVYLARRARENLRAHVRDQGVPVSVRCVPSLAEPARASRHAEGEESAAWRLARPATARRRRRASTRIVRSGRRRPVPTPADP